MPRPLWSGGEGAGERGEAREAQLRRGHALGQGSAASQASVTAFSGRSMQARMVPSPASTPLATSPLTCSFLHPSLSLRVACMSLEGGHSASTASLRTWRGAGGRGRVACMVVPNEKGGESRWGVRGGYTHMQLHSR